MGIFEEFPYTNFHELNANWILKKIKEMKDDINELKTKVEDLETRVEALEGGNNGNL